MPQPARPNRPGSEVGGSRAGPPSRPGGEAGRQAGPAPAGQARDAGSRARLVPFFLQPAPLFSFFLFQPTEPAGAVSGTRRRPASAPSRRAGRGSRRPGRAEGAWPAAGTQSGWSGAGQQQARGEWGGRSRRWGAADERGGRSRWPEGGRAATGGRGGSRPGASGLPFTAGGGDADEWGVVVRRLPWWLASPTVKAMGAMEGGGGELAGARGAAPPEVLGPTARAPEMETRPRADRRRWRRGRARRPAGEDPGLSTAAGK